MLITSIKSRGDNAISPTGLEINLEFNNFDNFPFVNFVIVQPDEVG